MIPDKVDWIALINALNAVGLRDHAVETLCKLTAGYVAQVRCGNSRRPNYEYAARILNLAEQQGIEIARFHVEQAH